MKYIDIWHIDCYSKEVEMQFSYFVAFACRFGHCLYANMILSDKTACPAFQQRDTKKTVTVHGTLVLRYSTFIFTHFQYKSVLQ